MRSGLIVGLLLFPLMLLAQELKTFSYSDSTFQRGQIHRTYNITFQGTSAHFTQEAQPALDSLVDFLQAHKELILEIGVHLPEGYVDFYEINNNKPDQTRAKALIEHLTEMGISHKRLNPVGYGPYQPLISKAELDAMPEEEQAQAALKNLRIEFKILGVMKQ